MDKAFLEELGLTVTTSSGGVVEAALDLSSGGAINPLTRQPIDKVSFTVVGDRLLYVSPPEFVGAQPINLAFLTKATRLEDLVVQTLNDHLYQLERRSSELSALGVNPKVDAATLQLTAELERPPLKFVITANRTGQFRVLRTYNDGAELTGGTPSNFELSEFRDRKALEAFLFAMFSDVVTTSPPRSVPSPAPQPAPDVTIAIEDIAVAFADAVLPPRSALELLVELKVMGQPMRFAAARVQGRTFRGLLAGTTGKLWADRFELDAFPGVRQLVAEVLEVDLDEVEVVRK